MIENKFLKVLCSIPIIIIFLYFIPFLGVCLIIFRYIIYRNIKLFSTPIYLLIIGFVLLIPKAMLLLLTTFKLMIKTPYLEKIVSSNYYIKIISLSRLLIILGVVFIIVSYIVKLAYEKLRFKLTNKVQTLMQNDLQKDYEIRKENDLRMQEKREKAKNTCVIYCPYCGADNLLTEQTGTCNFCRRKIEYKK